MPVTQNFILPNQPVVFESYHASKALVPIVPCASVGFPPFVGSLNDLWSCIRCGAETEYKIPFVRGDVFPFQFNLEDTRNPAFGIMNLGWRTTANSGAGLWYISAELYSGDCTTLIYSNVDEFCADWWVARDERLGSIQTIFVDTNLLPAGQTHFQIKISLREATGAGIKQTLVSEVFELVRCEDSVFVTADYASYDCMDKRYKPLLPRPEGIWIHNTAGADPLGYEPTKFYSGFRYLAEIVRTGFRKEDTLNDNEDVIKRKNIDVFSLNLLRPIPPDIAKILATQTQANSVEVEGQLYVNFADFDQNSEQIGRMYISEIECEQVCRTSNYDCD